MGKKSGGTARGGRGAEDSAAPAVALINLGCAKNTVDSETALGELLGAGFCLSPEAAEADLVLINTCGFIEPAREESCRVISEILELKDAGGRPAVAVLGCLPQRLGAELRERFPALDGVFGFGAYGKLPEFCRKLLRGNAAAVPAANADFIYEGPRLLTTPPSYAYLRLSEGCDNCCSYCAIPSIRGRHRSRKAENILSEAAELEQAGVRELALVAQDVTAYGRDLGGGECLERLLEQLLLRTESARLRVMYAHPAGLNSGLIDILEKEARVCKYLDLPLQHVNSRILQMMNRRYGRAEIDRIVCGLRSRAAEFALRTTVIVGFPGETEAEFAELLEFVEAGHFQHLGAFAYSPEPGTPAAGLGGVLPLEEAGRRLEAVLLAQQRVAFAWLDGRLGRTEEVLLDGPAGRGWWTGRTQFEAPEVDNAILIKGKEFCSGEIIRACLMRRVNYDIQAKLR